jgi:hypothetical protein
LRAIPKSTSSGKPVNEAPPPVDVLLDDELLDDELLEDELLEDELLDDELDELDELLELDPPPPPPPQPIINRLAKINVANTRMLVMVFLHQFDPK